MSNYCANGHKMIWSTNSFCSRCGAPRVGRAEKPWFKCWCGGYVLSCDRNCTGCGKKWRYTPGEKVRKFFGFPVEKLDFPPR